MVNVCPSGWTMPDKTPYEIERMLPNLWWYLSARRVKRKLGKEKQPSIIRSIIIIKCFILLALVLDSKSICIVSPQQTAAAAPSSRSIVISISISSISAQGNPDKIVVRLVSSAWNLLQGRMRFHACVCSSTRKGRLSTMRALSIIIRASLK